MIYRKSGIHLSENMDEVLKLSVGEHLKGTLKYTFCIYFYKKLKMKNLSLKMDEDVLMRQKKLLPKSLSIVLDL